MYSLETHILNSRGNTLFRGIMEHYDIADIVEDRELGTQIIMQCKQVEIMLLFGYVRLNKVVKIQYSIKAIQWTTETGKLWDEIGFWM